MYSTKGFQRLAWCDKDNISLFVAIIISLVLIVIDLFYINMDFYSAISISTRCFIISKNISVNRHAAQNSFLKWV